MLVKQAHHEIFRRFLAIILLSLCSMNVRLQESDNLAKPQMQLVLNSNLSQCAVRFRAKETLFGGIESGGGCNQQK
ncbi:MAG TPA: hypothetical protein DEF07_03250 [Nitrosomonas sp.]|nr:hypothetical protein [Nitrosomonas sp.]